jgi:hypothetical protein
VPAVGKGPADWLRHRSSQLVESVGVIVFTFECSSYAKGRDENCWAGTNSCTPECLKFGLKIPLSGRRCPRIDKALAPLSRGAPGRALLQPTRELAAGAGGGGAHFRILGDQGSHKELWYKFETRDGRA